MTQKITPHLWFDKEAKEATKAAIESGIIPGGGVTLLQAEKAIAALKLTGKDEKAGADLVRSILEEPLRMLAINSGEDADKVLKKVREKNGKTWGFNA